MDESEVIVVGAGLAGAAAAIGLADRGFGVTSCGALERMGHGRTVALFGPSIDLLKSFGIWEEIESAAAPLRSLRIIDDTGSLFASRPADFNAREIDLDAFGWNIENAILAEILGRRLESAANIRRRVERVEKFAFETRGVRLSLEGGEQFAGRLVVGADGRGSPARKAAGIDARVHAYGQSALTLTLSHARPHEDCSTEFHTREGPFTLVPLPPTDSAPNRSSLVWVMSETQGRRRAALDDEKLAAEIEAQSHGLLGPARIEGARGCFPMVRQVVPRLTGPRLALVGDAAHAFPPIGAQGLNLGLRDVRTLIDVASEARGRRGDIGSPETLKLYERRRAPDIGLRTLAVNGLNLSLLSHFPPVDAMRGFGLTALRTFAPLRRLVMREGVSPALGR